MNKPRRQYCGEEMEPKSSFGGRAAITPEEIKEFPWAVTTYYECKHCHSRSPFCYTPEEARAAAMKQENKYREQVEFDIKAALNALNCNSYQMPYHIYSMLFDQISAIGYTPSCGADMRKEANDE